MVYQWKSAAQISGLDPQKCGLRLEQSERKKGTLTPEAVVEDARNATSPLHNGFTWDNKAAAEAHRLNEARYILRQIVVVTEPAKTEDDEPKTIRAFVAVQEEDEDGKTYVNVTDALSDPKLRAQVLARAYSELQAWKVRYEALEEFAQVRKAIQTVKLSKVVAKQA